jgi:hypothetical protein
MRVPSEILRTEASDFFEGKDCLLQRTVLKVLPSLMTTKLIQYPSFI